MKLRAPLLALLCLLAGGVAPLGEAGAQGQKSSHRPGELPARPAVVIDLGIGVLGSHRRQKEAVNIA